MNETSAAILWYYKESLDTLAEIQIFNNEASAREFLKSASTEDSYPKLVTNLSVFVENDLGHLIKK